MIITLNVYEDDMKTVRQVHNAETVKIPFGIIRKLMKLFNIDSMDNTTEILKIVTSSWEDVISILDNIFPVMTDEDWDHVDTKELISVVYKILKNSFRDILSIPSDPKN